MVGQPVKSGVRIEHIDWLVRDPIGDVRFLPHDITAVSGSFPQHLGRIVQTGHLGVRPAGLHGSGDFSRSAAKIENRSRITMVDPTEQLESRSTPVVDVAGVLMGIPLGSHGVSPERRV
jgi:hypothetical protein